MTRIYNSYIPSKDADIAIWAGNILAKIDAAGTQTGLSADRIANWKKSALALINNINEVEAKKREQDRAVTTKENSKLVELVELRTAIAHLKTLPDYTNAMGGDLGIIGSSYTVDNAAIKPLVKVRSENGIVRVQFKKMRQPGVNIYCRIQGASTFEKLTYDHTSPFLDTRPAAVAGQAETREYKVVCSDGKQEVGRDSDIVSVLFGG
jgi:hypothetical protein